MTKRFYVECDVDAGQMMSCCDVIQCESRAAALKDWPALVRGHVCYAEQGPDVLVEVRSEFDGCSDKVVLEAYRDGKFTDRRRLGGAILAMLGLD